MTISCFSNLSVLLIILSLNANAATNCGDRISKIICEVAPTEKMQDRFTVDRPCLNKPIQKYQKLLSEAFKKFPPFLKERFCSLEKIYIEDEFFGAAWSTPVDEKNPVRFLIGLRKAELDLNLSLENGRAQFDSQTFGIATKVVSYTAVPENRLTSSEFTLIHELGHTYDYEYNYNRSSTDPAFSKSWTAISWKDIQEIKPVMDFPLRRSICLNNCKGKYVPTKDAMQLYSDLYAHGFLSQLAATNAMEDFADSFAFFVTDEILHVEARADVNASKFDLHQVESAPAFDKKREFLKKVVKQETK